MKISISARRFKRKAITEAYLYRWTQLSTGMWYEGSRTMKGCHPNDGYICSSMIVKPMILNNPSDWNRTVLLVGEPKYIRDMENKRLKSLDAKSDPMSYNRDNADGKFTTTGRKLKIWEIEKRRGRIPWNKNLDTGCVWFNNNIDEKQMVPGEEPEGWQLGRLPSNIFHYNNGEEERCFPLGEEPDGWVKGRLTNKYKRYNNGDVERMFEIGKEEKGFILGCLPNKKWYNNGVEQKQFVVGTQPEEWVTGKIDEMKQWFNDGIRSEMFVPGTEPSGYVKGMVTNGKRHYNNGIESKKFVPGTEPTGWILGRLLEVKKSYNNGLVCKKFVPGTEPSGWEPGRLKFKHTKKREYANRN